MTMATEKSVKGFKQVLRERLEMIAKGSCKECRFCGLIHWEVCVNEDIDGVLCGKKATHYCAIQGNMNSIQFSVESLDSKAYPARCDEGCWEETMDCFAFQPKLNGWELGPSTEGYACATHRERLKILDEAQRLDNSIDLVHSGVAESRLRKILYELVTHDQHEARADDVLV